MNLFKYKISIGSNIIDGPWGGGNQFAISLTEYLKAKNWEVVGDLSADDIDIILMTEPRRNLKSCKYNQLEISRYVAKKPDTVVVHRINECDERKGTKNVNNYLKRANSVADFTIFISAFLKRLFIDGNILDTANFAVIRNGADRKIFNMEGRNKWDGKNTLKIVTHHWGGNYYKGFDIYELIDKLSGNKSTLNIELNYIGNLPQNFSFMNSKVHLPLKGKELASKIKENHIYITASINEPAGMHHIEGALCGLPLLYRNSGGLPEYAKGFGIMFEGKEDIFEKLAGIAEKYDYYFSAMEKYPYDSERMCYSYEDLFIKLLGSRKNFDLIQRRKKYKEIYFKEKFVYKHYKGDN